MHGHLRRTRQVHALNKRKPGQPLEEYHLARPLYVQILRVNSNAGELEKTKNYWHDFIGKDCQQKSSA